MCTDDVVMIPRDEYNALRAAFERLRIAQLVYQKEIEKHDYRAIEALDVALGIGEYAG